MPLTDAQIKGLKHKAGKRYSKADGGGLLLDVTPGGVKSWVFRYRLNGKREKCVIGHYPNVSLKEARAERDKLATMVRAGRSPFIEQKLARTGFSVTPSVEEFAERYYREQVVNNWKDPKHIRRYIDNEILPALGRLSLKDVTPMDVQKLVYRKRDNGHAAAAIQLRGVIKRMYDYAEETHQTASNPAARVSPRYIGRATRRQRNLAPKEIREYLRVVYRSNIRRQFKLALHILLLTLVRKSMLLMAEWDEIDYKSGEWTIPREHMKGRKGEEHEHIVYMSRQVKNLFRELQKLAGDSKLVLPGRGSTTRPFAKNALNKALEALTFEMEDFTIHDLRRTASTQLREKGWDRDVVEKALSHEKPGVAGIYDRAEHAAERKKMLQWWSDFVDGLMNESKVIAGNFGNRAR